MLPSEQVWDWGVRLMAYASIAKLLKGAKIKVCVYEFGDLPMLGIMFVMLILFCNPFPTGAQTKCTEGLVFVQKTSLFKKHDLFATFIMFVV